MENNGPIIVFDDDSKGNIFESMGIAEEDGYLVDEEGFIQTNDQFEIVKPSEFGGVLRGSKVVIKKDSSELTRYFANLI